MARKISVESFGPELMAALLQGAAGKFEVSMPYRKAIKLRQRIYQLRLAMKQANHDKHKLVARTRVTIEWPEDTKVTRTQQGVSYPNDRGVMCRVLVQPADSEFKELFEQAGVDTKLGDELDKPSTGASGDLLSDIIGDGQK